jgi:mRNA interferase HigB
MLPFWLHNCLFLKMRVIAVQSLKQYWEKFPRVKEALLAWYEEAVAANWEHPNGLNEQYRNISIISEKRVVFNVCGNSYRLIVDIEYRLKIVFVVWFGTHAEYDKIDAKTIRYDKTYKN